jgi:hypothetical protein
LHDHGNVIDRGIKAAVRRRDSAAPPDYVNTGQASASFEARAGAQCHQQEDVMKKFLIAAATALALTGPALASQCPALMQEVDAAMETSQASAEDKAKAMELRESGEAAHTAGDHAKSEADLNQALELLAGM